MAVGGDILEVTCNHPELGMFVFLPKAGTDGTIDPGGFRSADDASGVDGGGNMIDQMNRVRGYFETEISVDMVTKRESKAISQLSGHTLPGVWTVTHISGTVYEGKGKPVGDVNFNTNTATMKLKVACAQGLKEI